MAIVLGGYSRLTHCHHRRLLCRILLKKIVLLIHVSRQTLEYMPSLAPVLIGKLHSCGHLANQCAQTRKQLVSSTRANIIAKLVNKEFLTSTDF